MKKNRTVKRIPQRESAWLRGGLTIGLDLGDRSSRYCVLDEHGEVLREAATVREQVRQRVYAT